MGEAKFDQKLKSEYIHNRSKKMMEKLFSKLGKNIQTVISSQIFPMSEYDWKSYYSKLSYKVNS